MANIENGRATGGNGRGGTSNKNGIAESAALSDDATAKGSNWREEDREREAYRRQPPYRAAGETDERMSRDFRRGTAYGQSSGYRSDEMRASSSVQHSGDLTGWSRWATLIGGGLLVRHGLRHGGLTGLASLAIGGAMAWAGANGRMPAPRARTASPAAGAGRPPRRRRRASPSTSRPRSSTASGATSRTCRA